MLGIGSMLHALGGGSPKSPSDYYGRKIAAVDGSGDDLRLTFDDGVTISIRDDGQSCCEHRYMRTDDDLGTLVGHKLVGIETNEARSGAADENDDYGEHEVVFLDVKTDGGMISFSFHNEHNGYYGGFGLALDEVSS